LQERTMAYRRMGMTISATIPKKFEIEQAKQFTDMVERTKGKVVALQDKRLQLWLTRTRKTKKKTPLDKDYKEKHNERGVDAYANKPKKANENSNEMNGHVNWTRNEGADENTNKINGHENWKRNCKPNGNAHMDETEMIILKKRKGNTERTMTPGDETHFLM
jgi:hypothetical protein